MSHARTIARGLTLLVAAALLALVIAGAHPAPALAAPGQAQTTSATLGSAACGGSSGGLTGLVKGISAFVTNNWQAESNEITCGVISALFHGITPTSFGPWLLNSLLAIPNFEQDGTNMSIIGSNTAAIGLGLLAATMTLAVIQYWLSGMMSMSGGSGGAEGIARGIGAAVLIVLWPWAFGQATAVANSLSAAVVNAGGQSEITNLINAAPLSGVAGLAVIASLLIALLAMVLLFGLLALKVAMGATLAVIYVAMPILIALGVSPSLSWLTRLALKGWTVILAIPLIWALVFAVFTGFVMDTLTFGNFTFHGAGVWGTLLRPVISLVLLFLLIALPMKLAKLASLKSLIPGASHGGGGPRGAMSRVGGIAMGQVVGGAVRSHMPSSMGGQASEMHYTRDADGAARVYRDAPPNMRRVKADSDEAQGVREEVEEERVARRASSGNGAGRAGSNGGGRRGAEAAAGAAGAGAAGATGAGAAGAADAASAAGAARNGNGQAGTSAGQAATNGRGAAGDPSANGRSASGANGHSPDGDGYTVDEDGYGNGYTVDGDGDGYTFDADGGGFNGDNGYTFDEGAADVPPGFEDAIPYVQDADGVWGDPNAGAGDDGGGRGSPGESPDGGPATPPAPVPAGGE